MKKILLVTIAISAFSCNAQSTSKEKARAQCELEAKPVYVKTYVLIQDLRHEVELAKQKMISKQRVINHFNNTAGKTMGIQSKLEGVDKQLKTGGDDYIQLMFLKEAARICLEKAAEADFEAKRLRNQK